MRQLVMSVALMDGSVFVKKIRNILRMGPEILFQCGTWTKRHNIRKETMVRANRLCMILWNVNNWLREVLICILIYHMQAPFIPHGCHMDVL